jgi:hypothetical protein
MTGAIIIMVIMTVGLIRIFYLQYMEAKAEKNN